MESRASSPSSVDDPMGELTMRERQTLEALSRGLTNAEIGRQLGLSRCTVRNYVSDLYGKIGVNGRVQAATWWTRHHPVDLTAHETERARP